MSHNTGNFVHELVVMAKAFEELPQVREELNRVNNQLIETLQQVQRLELKLIDRADQIETLHAHVRKVEAERDDAEFRFLEADDKIAGFTRLIKDQAKAFGLLLEAVEPAQPEPVSEPQAEVSVAVDPIATSTEVQSAPIAETAIQASATELTQPTNGQTNVDPGPAIGTAFHGDPGNVDSVSTAPAEGVNVPSDPTIAPTLNSDAGRVASQSANDVASISTEEVATRSADPTPASVSSDASAFDGWESSPPMQPDPSGSVGYHNEPDFGDYAAWDEWFGRMNDKFGVGNWPVRPATA